jgi:integrase
MGEKSLEVRLILSASYQLTEPCGFSKVVEFLESDGKQRWKEKLGTVKIKRGRVKYFFTIEEINQVRPVMDESQELMLDILAESGVRRAVLIGLTPSHFDFKREVMKIPKNMCGNKSK